MRLLFQAVRVKQYLRQVLMEIFLDNISRKYNHEWVFRNLTFTFTSGNSYAVLGSNGSGKSTLLQIISGHLHPTGGAVQYCLNGSALPEEQLFRHIAITAPYIELIEEFTLPEMVSFHQKFRNFRDGIDANELMDILDIGRNRGKCLKYFSSGMKQRVKLALAILSDVPVLLLDEPATNLDASGVAWYRSLLAKHCAERIVIVCSNSQPAECDFCHASLHVENYKGLR